MIEGDWSNLIPTRLPVDWEFRGEPRVHPDIEGISGRPVVFNIKKNFGRFEGFMAKLLRAPDVVRRPMHYTQSMLWELMDGKRNFDDICQIMESLYHEDIAPASDRVRAYLEVFVKLNVATLLKSREEE